MRKNKKEEFIPLSFNTIEEAGEFWDNHSADDYRDEMEEVEMEFDIQKRVFLVPVNDRLYQRVKKHAKEKHSTVEKVVNTLLEKQL